VTETGTTSWLSESEASIELSVRVVPRAKRHEIVGTFDGALKVRLAAPPVDGAANSALVRFLADCLQVRQRDVAILRGHSSRQKTVSVVGVTAQHALAHIKPFLK